jgi:hypothetical protein
VAVGALFGVVTTVALLGERVLNATLGIDWQRLGGLAVSPGSASWYVVTPVAEGLVIATYTLVGMGIGVAYSRYGPRLGTFVTLALLLPAALVDAATGTGILGVILMTEEGPAGPAPVPGLVGALLAAVLSAVAYRLLLQLAHPRPPR